MNRALRLVLENYSLKEREQVRFEGCNWTVGIDPNSMYRICLKTHHQGSIHCNIEINLFSFSVYFNCLTEDIFLFFFSEASNSASQKTRWSTMLLLT